MLKQEVFKKKNQHMACLKSQWQQLSCVSQSKIPTFYTTDPRNEQEKDTKAKEQTQRQSKLTRKSGHKPLSGKH